MPSFGAPRAASSKTGCSQMTTTKLLQLAGARVVLMVEDPEPDWAEIAGEVLMRRGVKHGETGEAFGRRVLENIPWLAQTRAAEGRPLPAQYVVLFGAGNAPMARF